MGEQNLRRRGGLPLQRPGRPSLAVPGVSCRLDDQRAEETGDFVAGLEARGRPGFAPLSPR